MTLPDRIIAAVRQCCQDPLEQLSTVACWFRRKSPIVAHDLESSSRGPPRAPQNQSAKLYRGL